MLSLSYVFITARGKKWGWLPVLLMLLKESLKLQFWNRSPLSLKACCLIDCHLSPPFRRASWQPSAKASDLHVFFWHLTNGNSLQICINSLCLTNNHRLRGVDIRTLAQTQKGAGVCGKNKLANKRCFTKGQIKLFGLDGGFGYSSWRWGVGGGMRRAWWRELILSLYPQGKLSDLHLKL